MKPGRATWNDLGAAYLANWMYSSARQIIVIVVAVEIILVVAIAMSRMSTKNSALRVCAMLFGNRQPSLGAVNPLQHNAGVECDRCDG